MTREEALKLDSKELAQKSREISKVLDTLFYGNDDSWDETYAEYCMINSILNERYREENIVAFEKFFYENIYGKEWNQIEDDILDTYSDWHKDMFGYRPRSTDKDW